MTKHISYVGQTARGQPSCTHSVEEDSKHLWQCTVSPLLFRTAAVCQSFCLLGGFVKSFGVYGFRFKPSGIAVLDLQGLVQRLPFRFTAQQISTCLGFRQGFGKSRRTRNVVVFWAEGLGLQVGSSGSGLMDRGIDVHLQLLIPRVTDRVPRSTPEAFELP